MLTVVQYCEVVQPITWLNRVRRQTGISLVTKTKTWSHTMRVRVQVYRLTVGRTQPFGKHLSTSMHMNQHVGLSDHHVSSAICCGLLPSCRADCVGPAHRTGRTQSANGLGPSSAELQHATRASD
jgi:hypothetical protein